MARTALRVAAALTAAAVLGGSAAAETTGADMPAAVRAGRLAVDIDGLAPPARQRALSLFDRFGIPAADARHLRVAPDGALFYADPVRPAAHPFRRSSSREAAGRAIVKADRRTIFRLHSRPGAANVVYLNFKGGKVSGTAWNQMADVDAFEMLPYSEDANTKAFSQAEVNTIAEVWARMAEDYAPFDIDITTERPARFGPTTGHVMFSPRRDANGAFIFDSAVGGVAFVGVWGISNYPDYQPALVFPEGVSGAKNLTEAGSHELGHNLGLSHDGTDTEPYYRGHGTGNVSWGPIMGVGYYTAVTEWSKGEYARANNQQDDVAIIAGQLDVRDDDHAHTTTGATKLVVAATGAVTSKTPQTDPAGKAKANRGVIETRRDVDVFRIDVTRSGTVDLTVTPSWRDGFVAGERGSNLDVRATLYRGTGSSQPTNYGTKVADGNPRTETNASVTANVTRGTYFLVVSGVGVGQPKGTGYSDYGSLGQYTIQGTAPRP